MENIIKLASYRQKRQKLWMSKNKGRLFRILYDFISNHVPMNFLEAFESYQNMQYQAQLDAWDYLDLRDLLHEAMEGAFSQELYHRLKAEWWFDPKLLSKDEALEQCLSLYIMDSLHSVKMPSGASRRPRGF